MVIFYCRERYPLSRTCLANMPKTMGMLIPPITSTGEHFIGASPNLRDEENQ
jgi:hypothetical protein